MADNIYELPERRIIEEEAGQWLIRLDGDARLSDEEVASLRQWLNRSPAHREEFSSLLQFYNKMNILTELSVPLGKSHANEVARTPTFFGGKVLGYSFASIILVVVALVFWNQSENLDSTNGFYATAIGQQNSITLKDGSVVLLNTNSQMKVEYNQNVRNIELLQGEAYFDVAKNPQHPFRVYAGAGRVEAVGTAFSVRVKENDIGVMVTDGRVKLAAREPQGFSQADSIGLSNNEVGAPQERYKEALHTLDAGQSATIKNNEDSASGNTVGPIETIDEAELSQRLSWRDGLLIFNGDSLEQVVDEISRYSPLTIEIADPALKAIRIGGQFRIGDIDTMLISLETNFNLRIIRHRPNHIQIVASKA